MPTAASTWSSPISTSEANRRAGGRRHYNSMRQFTASNRAFKVLHLLEEYNFVHGARARIARELGVHPSTITRDLRKVLNPDGVSCPNCDRWMSYKPWARLHDGDDSSHKGDGSHKDEKSWLDLVSGR